MSGEDNPMMDRFDPPDPDEGNGSTEEKSSEEQADKMDGPDNLDNTDNTTQTEQTDKTDDSDGEKNDTRRNRPHTALYVSEGLVDQVEERFKKINGQLMIDGEDPLEKHKHFYEGLLKAGLQNDDLEEIVLSQREE
jgi:hypothetical protein